MSREKQIEEMAKDIQPILDKDWEDDCFPNGGEVAKALIDKSYRKQEQGEWIIKKGGYYQRLVCSACEKLSIATFDYCPNCGAHMKGDSDERN